MNILLIEPPFQRLYHPQMSLNKYPLSLAYLSSVVKEKTHHTVKVYNADFSAGAFPCTVSFLANEGYLNYRNRLHDLSYSVWTELSHTIRTYRPDLVGISAKSQNFQSVLNTARIVKSINPTTPVVIGGPHPTLAGDETVRHRDIDYAVRGEGEVTFVDLVDSISHGAPPDNVKGIMYLRDNRVINTPPREFIRNLDDLPIPYRYAKDILLDYPKYPVSAFQSILAIRGCPYRCTFCGSFNIWQGQIRYRSPQSIIDEIQFLRSMGVHYFNFDDDTFGVTRRYIVELANQLIQHCRGIRWSCEIHVNLATPEVLTLMQRAGCELIRLGIESGNNRILREIGKNITIERAMRVGRLFREHGMNARAFFMIGFPRDTESTIRDTLMAIRQFPGPITYSIFTPYIGTTAYHECVALNLIPKPFDVSLYNHQSPKNHFCLNISENRFWEIARQIEKIVDRKNTVIDRCTTMRRWLSLRPWIKLSKMAAAALQGQPLGRRKRLYAGYVGSPGVN